MVPHGLNWSDARKQIDPIVVYGGYLTVFDHAQTAKLATK
jgi:hypothetical protein